MATQYEKKEAVLILRDAFNNAARSGSVRLDSSRRIVHMLANSGLVQVDSEVDRTYTDNYRNVKTDKVIRYHLTDEGVKLVRARLEASGRSYYDYVDGNPKYIMKGGA